MNGFLNDVRQFQNVEELDSDTLSCLLYLTQRKTTDMKVGTNNRPKTLFDAK